MKRAQLFCLALTMAAASVVAFAARTAPANDNLPKPIWFGQLVFSIPYNLTGATAEQQPARVQLYVSTDRGTTWKLAQTVTTDKKNFDFRAPAEGEYGFLIREIDRQGRISQQPAGPPQLRVVVDVTPPKLELAAVRAASGEVRTTWKATDPLLNADSLKIEYQVTGGSWRAVAIDRSQPAPDDTISAGSVNVWPAEALPPPSAINIRAEILDRAGNPTRVQTKTQAAAAETVGPQFEADQTTNNTRNPWPDAATRWQAERTSAGPTDRNRPEEPPHMAQNPAWPPHTERNDGSQFSMDPGDTNRAIVSNVHPPIRNQQPIADDPRERRYNDRDTRSDSRTSRTDSPAPSRPQEPFQLPNGQRPRLVNSKSFEMDYEIKSIGPSGISKFELWGTRDAGRTWTSYGVDKDNRPPMRVNVEAEGLYGFRSTVQSGNGLGSPAPRSGDEPELLILVDLTKPQVRLSEVQAGANEHAGELLIRWEAADAGLADHPVTLLYSDSPAGQWSIIVANLNASGSYNWRPDDRAPDRVFLRVEARDEAGNVGAYQTQEPVALDRARPEVRLRGVRPVNDSASRVQQYNFR